jgi:plasmid maintenance system killer protein
MDRIADQRLVEIHAARTIPDLPADLCQQAYRILRLVLAARTRSDLDIFTRFAELADGHLAIHVQGKWIMTFTWSEGFGATDLALSRI